MNEIQKQFEENRYVYLQNALSKEECAAVTKHLFDLYENGTLTKDEQCPLSDSVYDDVILNHILNKMEKPLSDMLGINLKSAYCYARIYRPGEVLEYHYDRPACEISGTMTLGFDPNDKVWPIFFGKHKGDEVGVSVDIGVGDLVMYRGEELPHWRNAFKGTWQTQVFFHYVDADGENKEHAGDSYRKQQEQNQPVVDQAEPFSSKKSVIYDGVMLRNSDDRFPGLSTFHSKNLPELCFTADECDRIINLAESLYEVKGTTGTGETEGTFNEEVRSVRVYDVHLEEDTKWIFDKIAYAAGKANKEYYKYNLLGITHALQLLEYNPGGHYDWHIDAGDGSAATRKLSIVVPLSKRTDFEGGGLKANNNGTAMDVIMERGSISTFPSYMPHKVEPVTSGKRWSLVSWIHGPDRFK